MILRIRVAKGPVLLILGEAAEVVKQGGHGRDAAVVFRKAKACGNAINGRADPEGVCRLHVQASLVQGIRFLEGQDMVLKPVLKKMELRIVHAEVVAVLSREPVLYGQSRNSGKMTGVSGYQHELIGQGDCGNLKISKGQRGSRLF